MRIQVACDIFMRAQVDIVILEVGVKRPFSGALLDDGMLRTSTYGRRALTHIPTKVGIGGRLDDTTAAISAGTALREDGSKQQLFECVACGVTLLDFDHTQILGGC